MTNKNVKGVVLEGGFCRMDEGGGLCMWTRREGAHRAMRFSLYHRLFIEVLLTWEENLPDVAFCAFEQGGGRGDGHAG